MIYINTNNEKVRYSLAINPLGTFTIREYENRMLKTEEVVSKEAMRNFEEKLKMNGWAEKVR